MAWDKAYPEAGIPWDNDNSPYLNETNMGIIDEALKTHDERIIELYGTRQTVAGYADAAQTAEINALAYSNNAQAQAVNSQVSAAYSQAEADRAKTYADNAEAIVGIGIATTDKAGIVKASDTITVDADGTMHSLAKGTVELTQAEYDALTETEKMNGTLYVITDRESSLGDASTVAYGDISVKTALDELMSARIRVGQVTLSLNSYGEARFDHNFGRCVLFLMPRNNLVVTKINNYTAYSDVTVKDTAVSNGSLAFISGSYTFSYLAILY